MSGSEHSDSAGWWPRADERRGTRGRVLTIREAIEMSDARRGKSTPSLPKLRFMEGLGPEDPKYAPER